MDTPLIEFNQQSKEIGEILYKELIEGHLRDKEELKILYIGTTFQRDFLKPFLEKLVTENERYDDFRNAIETIKVCTLLNKKSLEIFTKDHFPHTILTKSGGDPYDKVKGVLYQKIKVDMPNLSFHPQENEDTSLINASAEKKKVKDISLDIIFNEDNWIDLDDPNKTANVFNKDIFSAFRSEDKTTFDIIICPLEFHFCMNWRLGTLTILDYLEPNGIFVFTEISGSIAIIDGAPGKFMKKPSPDIEKLIRLIRKFDAFRSEHYHWKPEISFTNYSEVRNFIEQFFFEPVTEKTTNTKTDPWKINSHNFRQFIRQKMFSYLSVGIDTKKLEKFLKQYDKLIDDTFGEEGCCLDKQLKLYICKGFSRKRYEGLMDRNWNWNYTTLGKDISQINDFDPDTLKKRSLDLLVSHDVFLPQHTYALMLISWNEHKSTWRYPIYSAFNDKLFNDLIEKTKVKLKQRKSLIDERPLERSERMRLESLLQYEYKNKELLAGFFSHLLIVESLANESILEMIFGKLKRKIPFVFEFQEGSKIENIDFDPEFDTKGDLKKISFIIPEAYVDRVTSEEKLIPIKKLQLSKLDKSVDAFEVKNNFISQIKINETIQTVLDEVISDIDKDKSDYYKLIGSKDFDSIMPEFNRLLMIEESGSNAIASMFSIVIYAFCRYLKYFPGSMRLAFFPSVVVEDAESNSDNNNMKKAKGLGGLILVEKIPKQKNNEQYLINARDGILHRISNLIFYKAGVVNYVRQDFWEIAHKAAIAAISTRNISHNIGSHVLPNIMNTQNLNDDVVNYRTLIKYVQQRNDFINFLAMDIPNWTIPSWFVKDIMLRFYQQYFLLDNLVKSEGIKAYKYHSGNEVKIFNQDIEEVENNIHEVINQSGKDIYIYGFLYYNINDDKYYVANNECTNNQLPDDSICAGPIDIKEKDRGITPNRKLKISGTFSKIEGNKVLLDSAKMIENSLVIKIRRRIYLKVSYQNGTYLFDEEKYEYFKKIGFVDLGMKNMEAKHVQILKTRNPHILFYSIVTEVNIAKGRLIVYCDKKINKDEKIIVECGYSLETFLRQCRNEISRIEGSRIFISGNIVNKEEFWCIEDAIITGISKIQYLVGTSFTQAEQKAQLDKDILISIPGGITGYQAFYTILENIIRNSAKHNWMRMSREDRMGRNLEVKIEFDDQNDKDYLICKIWTNTWFSSDKGLSHSNEQLDNLIVKLKSCLESDIIDDSSKVIKDHLGLSEIKINAAFLSQGSQMINELAGEQILLKDKLSDNGVQVASTGYIRPSRIIEYENHQLVNRLGYRFKLKKPKELLIIRDIANINREDDYFKSFEDYDQINVVTVDEILKCEEDRALDYDFCLMLESANFPASTLPFLLQQWINLPDTVEMKKVENLFELIHQKLETYPNRLFFITEKDLDNYIDFRKQNSESYTNKNIYSARRLYFKFIRNRVTFMTESDLHKMLKPLHALNLMESFLLQLHHKSMSKLRGFKDEKDYLLYIFTDISSSEKVYDIQTVPYVLRSMHVEKQVDQAGNLRVCPAHTIPDFDNGHLFSRKIFLEEESIKGQEYSIVAYKRHGRVKEKREVIINDIISELDEYYAEQLSGNNISFNLFKSLPVVGTYAYYKFLFQLIENGLTTYLIVDERFSKFVKENAYYELFHNSNIIVPLKVSYDDNILIQDDPGIYPDKELKTVEPGRLKITYRELNEKCSINCLIIHQSLLEQMTSQDNIMIDLLIRDLKYNISNPIPVVIITSGKGKPSSMSKYAKFIPFNAIEALLMNKYPDRLLFTQALFKTFN